MNSPAFNRRHPGTFPVPYTSERETPPKALYMMMNEELFTWREEAACRGMDPALFFPGPDEDPERALAVCRTCPVRDECLEWAIAAHERYGIWGGTTEQERRRLARRSA